MSPTSKRKLTLADAEAVAAEVRRLRRGCRKAGNWTLPQVCWHLKTVMTFSMMPPPHQAFEIDPGAKAVLAKLLATGEVPAIKAPERALPPETAGEADIDGFLETLEKFKSFRGPFAPHRLFGEIPFDDFVRLHLLHCSHHLGFLVPEAA